MKTPNKIQPKGFCCDIGGIAAVEFALIAPLIVMIFINVVSLFDGFRGQRMIARANMVALDLVTRHQTNFTDAHFDAVVAAAEAIAGDYADGNSFVITISSVRNPFDVDGKEDLELTWSRSSETGQELVQADLADYEFPTIPEADSVVLISVKAEYRPILISELIGTFLLGSDHLRRPRFVTELTCSSSSGAC